MPSSQILPFSHLDDNEFALALYEFHNGPVHYDHDRLVDLAFNPLISTIDQHLTCSDDLDPDLHFNTNSRCDYFNEDKLNNILSKMVSLIVISQYYILMFGVSETKLTI